MNIIRVLAVLSVSLVAGTGIVCDTTVWASPQPVNQTTLKQAATNQDLTRVLYLLKLHPQLASRADCLEQAGLLQAFYFDQREALKLLNYAHTLARANPHVTGSLAYVLAKNGKPGLALDLMQNVLDKNPKDGRTLAIKAYALALTAQTLASERLISQLQSVRVSSSAEAQLMLLRVRVAILLDQLKESEALALMDNYLGSHPNDLEALMMRAQCLRPLGKWKTSIDDLKRILQIAPDNSFALRTLADVYRQHDMFAPGADCYRRYLRSTDDPEQLTVGNRGLAHCLERLGRYSEASACRLAVLDANPLWAELSGEGKSPAKVAICREFSQDILNYATDLRACAKTKECLKPLNILLRHFPRQKASLHERALAYESLAQYKAARQDLDLLILEQPDYPRFYIDRARLHRALGEPGKAAADLERARVLEPR